MRVAAEVRELDRPALRLGQRFKDLAHGPVFNVLFGGERRVFIAGLGFGHLERRRPERGLAAEDVDGAMVDDRKEPGARVAPVAAVAAGAPPCREERVLDDVFRGFALAEDPIGQGVREAPIAVVQRGEGAQVPRGERSQEGVVGRLLFRHYEKCTVDGQERM